MRPTLYEYAGGDAAFLALAAAHHERCLADPELNHPFSHPDGNPQHVERLAAYWAEVLGGPPRFSQTMSDQTALQQLHAGNGDMSDLGRRFVACFVLAADDAGLPTDPAFRGALKAYMEWAVADVLTYSPEGSQVPANLSMPHWSWDGLQVTQRPVLRSGGARLATAADLDEVVSVLAHGFATDPVWGLWAMPGTIDRVPVFERYWRPFVTAALQFDGVFVSPGLEAVSLWVPPGVPEMDEATEEGFLELVEEIFGDRAPLLFGAFEAFSVHREPVPPHWYLSLLATHPDHRGRGHGMRLVADVLADVVDPSGLPAYLESTNDANLARYAAAGFVRHGAFSVPEGPTVTTMLRPALV